MRHLLFALPLCLLALAPSDAHALRKIQVCGPNGEFCPKFTPPPVCSGEGPGCVPPLPEPPPQCTGPNGVGDCGAVFEEDLDLLFAAGCAPLAEIDGVLHLDCARARSGLFCAEVEPALGVEALDCCLVSPDAAPMLSGCATVLVACPGGSCPSTCVDPTGAARPCCSLGEHTPFPACLPEAPLP